VQHESEHDADPGGDELPAPNEHPLEGGQTDAVDEAQEVAAENGGSADPRANSMDCEPS
jgi:hypothetical protein